MVSVTVVMAQMNGRQGQVKNYVELNQYWFDAPRDNTNTNTQIHKYTNTDAGCISICICVFVYLYHAACENTQ